MLRRPQVDSTPRDDAVLTMENVEKIRHSLAHILASAVLELHPKTKLGMGPAIENGFYYDFQLRKPLEEKDLQEIETKMKELISQKLKFEKQNITKRKAKKLFSYIIKTHFI